MSEAESDFDTAEGLYDEIDGLRVMLALREQQLGKLMVAARAVVDAVWSPSTNVYLAGSLICRICMSPDGRHSPSCPVRTLAALLERDA